MLVIINLADGQKLYRTCTRVNIRKVAKSIHIHFPDSNYPCLEGIIFNGIAKDLKELVLEARNE